MESRYNAYDRKMKIKAFFGIIPRFLIRTIWIINTFPLYLAGMWAFGTMFLLSLPVSLIVWLIMGDRPFHRMQPSNFFFLMFNGMMHGEDEYGNIVLPENLNSETPSMRMVYQVAVDLRFYSEYHYMSLINYYLMGKIHPSTGLKCHIPIRILAILLYGIATIPYIMIIIAIISQITSVQPEAVKFEKY